MFILQMSGFPGSGKSTLAKRVAERTGAIVIDHDIVKTAMQRSLGDEMDPKKVGAWSYDLEWALIEFHLSQGMSVIHDSPCLYDEMVRRGLEAAAKSDSQYKYVECVVDDVYEINRRLKTRYRLPSQIGPIPDDEVGLRESRIREVIQSSKRPQGIDCLRVDTMRPLESYVEEVIAYVLR